MVMISVLVLLGLGLVTATVLAVASRVFHVEEDPRVQAVLEALPGANCGGCGYAGCEGYATAVATDPAVPANRCCAGGAETSIAVGELTGKTVAASDPLVSFRRCDKVAGNVALRYDYQGMPSCAAAAGLVFQSYLAASIGVWLGLQAFVNVGVNMGLLPTKGLTLPLLSYGGSSMLVSMGVMGLLLRIHHETVQSGRPSATREARRE